MMSNSLSMELLHTCVTCQPFFPTLSVSLFVCGFCLLESYGMLDAENYLGLDKG